MAPKGGRLGPGKAFVTLYLDKSTVERLDALAAAQNMSRSKFCESLITEGLEESEVTVRAMSNPVIQRALFEVLGKPDVLRSITRSMRDELTDEQLELFQRAMIGATQAVEKAQPGRAAPAAPAAAPLSRGQRRGGRVRGKQGQGQGRG